MKAFTLYAVLGVAPFIACRAIVPDAPAVLVEEPVVAPAPVEFHPPVTPGPATAIQVPEPAERVVEEIEGRKFEYHRFSRSGGPIERKVIKKPEAKNVN